MSYRFIFLLFSLLLLYSCTPNKYKAEDLLGQWKFVEHKSNEPKVDENDPDYIPDYSFKDHFVAGFDFKNEQEVDWKQGFYRVKSSGKEDYLGTQTTYRVIGDSLKIYHKVHGKWNAYKILSLTPDSLKISTKNGYDSYAKLNYKTDDSEHYDQIIMTTSGCYGSCPIFNLSIDNKGNMFFWGRKYTTKIGMYKAPISLEEFRYFEESFKQSDIKNLKDHYAASWTDDQTVSISFVKDGTIVKSVSDYGMYGPTELIWAYNDLSYLYMRKNLEELTANIPFDLFGELYFSDKQHFYPMYESEMFFLAYEIMTKASVSNQNFKPLYFTTDYIWEYEEKIDTDGRFYKVKQDNKTVVYDLGYNFIARNHIEKRKVLRE